MWVPAVLMLVLVSSSPVAALLSLVVAFLVVMTLYARGSTVGTRISGFGLRTRNGESLGWRWGFALAGIALVSPLFIAVVTVSNFIPTGDASGFLGDSESYPILGQRAQSRPVLERADDYWDRWAT